MLNSYKGKLDEQSNNLNDSVTKNDLKAFIDESIVNSKDDEESEVWHTALKSIDTPSKSYKADGTSITDIGNINNVDDAINLWMSLKGTTSEKIATDTIKKTAIEWNRTNKQHLINDLKDQIYREKEKIEDSNEKTQLNSFHDYLADLINSTREPGNIDTSIHQGPGIKT